MISNQVQAVQKRIFLRTTNDHACDDMSDPHEGLLDVSDKGKRKKRRREFLFSLPLDDRKYSESRMLGPELETAVSKLLLQAIHDRCMHLADA